jgi:hypothetical protein
MGGVYIAVNEADSSFVVGVFEDCFDELIHGCNPRSTRNKTHGFMSTRQPQLRLGWEKLVFFPFVFGDGAADGELLADVHVV